MADVFREINEELRREKAARFWARYQYLIIGVALAIIVAAGGWRYWQYSTQQAAEAAGARFAQAVELAQAGKSKEAQEAFESIAMDGPAGYALLARFRAAHEIARRDPADALNAYDSIAADTAASAPIREAAQLRAAFLAVDHEDFSQVRKRLEPLAREGGTYRLSALELLALAAFRAEEYDLASGWLDQIVAAPDAPDSIRRRAGAIQGLVAGSRPGPALPERSEPAPLAAPEPAAPASEPAPTFSTAPALPDLTPSPEATPVPVVPELPADPPPPGQ